MNINKPIPFLACIDNIIIGFWVTMFCWTCGFNFWAMYQVLLMLFLFLWKLIIVFHWK